MIRQSWRTHLKAAVREKEVLAVVGGFLAEWSQAEISQLPASSWPARMSGGADVLAHAALLAGLHARFDGDASALPGLQEMLLFFTHAAVRTAKIRVVATAADPPGDCEARPKRHRSKATRRRAPSGNARVALRR